ncbi:hypothetical protein AK812_SmicGene11479 [Symbiodinium microadriaticum]|uniref:Uncharacterized protein n=1 Tax=Symbiodinium microadriaticum TaxID=2951 RepID=A0A1Q9ED90_SYMMI|nr:hypothetical protein AK812_SmicGene11479 [Symbiodinium microadriaticum]
MKRRYGEVRIQYHLSLVFEGCIALVQINWKPGRKGKSGALEKILDLPRRCSDAIHDGDASLEVLQLEAGTCRVDAAEEVTRGGGISVVEEFRRAGQASSLASGVALGWFLEAYASATIGCPKVRTSVVSALFAAGKESHVWATGCDKVGMPLDLASVSAQLELNDIPESAHEPGPGHYFGPDSQGFNALGKQMFSKCRSAPEISLPRTGWDEWQKVTVSKASQGTNLGRESPSCAYTVPSTLEGQAPKVGTSLRPDLAASLGVDPHGSPGPMYNIRESGMMQLGIGRVVKSRENKSFGCADRFRGDARGTSIGPGQYRRKDFALRGDNGRSIGTGRQAWEKVVTPGWECEGRCRASPGVGPPLWTDVSKDGSPGVSMPRADRFPRTAYASCSPGPIYTLPNEREAKFASKAQKKPLPAEKKVMEKAKLKPPPPPPPTCGKPPKKPRFRMHLVHSLSGAKHGMWGYF